VSAGVQFTASGGVQPLRHISVFTTEWRDSYGQSEPIKNPVTGEPHRVRVTLPHGFEYHEAEYASARVTTERSPIALDYAGSHAHFARLNWTPAGPVHV
jgi:hypothetical protein